MTTVAIGRNDPCPCGSGKKYKKCCFKRDQVDKRLEQTQRTVEEILDPDASIYRVWLEWRTARKLADFNFLYDLIEPDSPLFNSVGDKTQFVADCSDGNAVVPCGEPAIFKYLQILEGERARLLQTIGDDDSASPDVRCECVEFTKTERGWRLAGFDSCAVTKADRDTIALALFD